VQTFLPRFELALIRLGLTGYDAQLEASSTLSTLLSRHTFNIYEALTKGSSYTKYI